MIWSALNAVLHFSGRCCIFPTADFSSWLQHQSKRMSQLQFQCPPSAIPAASAPLQLGQLQPGYSIPCATGALPSESASQPIRSSALPAGSATPYNTTTGLFALKYILVSWRMLMHLETHCFTISVEKIKHILILYIVIYFTIFFFVNENAKFNFSDN